MKAITRKRLARRKQRIAYRLREIHWAEQRRPMLAARNIRYEVADRARGLAAGGIGAIHLPAAAAEEIVREANGRANQENLIEQLKNGARAMEMPVGDLVSNWAYMVMASLAWTLKAWLALGLPEGGRWRRKRAAEKQAVLRMKFKKFLNLLVRVPCQIVRTGRRIVYRVLGWNPWLGVLLRGVEALRGPPGLGRRHPLRC